MILNKGQYLVLATSTDLGKTFFVTEICKKLIKKNFFVNAIKPVLSGFVDDGNSDSAKILAALNQETSLENIKEISPYRFKEPLSPALAAKKENKEIDFEELKNFCLEKINEAKKTADYFFIEGAGGVMSPLTYQKTFLDLAESLKLPVLLIGGNYLGSISDILCALEALKSRKVQVEMVILNDLITRGSKIDLDDNISQIESLSGEKIVKIDDFLTRILK